MKLSVIIPVYNERETIGELVRRVRAVPIDKQIIVVNDGSSDGTAKVLAELPAGDDLQVANRVIRDSGEACIAVVDNLENMRFVGELRERDMMAAYNRALHEARAEERGD